MGFEFKNGAVCAASSHGYLNPVDRLNLGVWFSVDLLKSRLQDDHAEGSRRILHRRGCPLIALHSMTLDVL